MLTRNKLIAIKPESVYGTDSMPGNPQVLIANKESKIQPLQHDSLDNSILQPKMGHDPVLHVGGWGMVEIETAIPYADQPGDPQALDAMIRAAGFSSTSIPGQRTVYASVDKNHESATIYAYEQDDLTKMVGCRGSGVIELNAKSRPLIKSSFTGLSAGPIAGTLPNAVLQPVKVLPIEDSNSSFTLDGRTEVMDSLTIDLGLSVSYQNLVGVEEVVIVDSKPTVKVTIRRPPAGTKNYYAEMKANRLVVGRFRQEVNKIGFEFLLNGMQLAAVSESEKDGFDMLELEYRLIHTTNPVVQFTFGTLPDVPEDL